MVRKADESEQQPQKHPFTTQALRLTVKEKTTLITKLFAEIFCLFTAENFWELKI